MTIGAQGLSGTLLGAGIPVPPAVHAACEMLGLDPLYVADEGVLVAPVPAGRVEELLDALRGHAGISIPRSMTSLKTKLRGTQGRDVHGGHRFPLTP